MPRPIPTYLRGGKRADVRDKTKSPRRHVLSCPRVCPKWEFDAWRALIKPQFKAAIEHRDPQQHWPAGADAIVAAATAQFDQTGRGRASRDDADEHLRI